MLLRKRAWDIMRDEFAKVSETDTLDRAIAELDRIRRTQPDAECVLVFAQDGRLAGAMCMGTILRAVLECMPTEKDMKRTESLSWEQAYFKSRQICEQKAVKDLYNRVNTVVSPEDPIQDVIQKILKSRRGWAVVADGEKVIGYLMLSDLYKEAMRDLGSWDL